MPITLIVEDGTKPTNANTYISLADAEVYHTAMGNVDWTTNTDDEAKKQALVLATQSIDLLYGSKFESYIYFTSNQSLLFPRAQFWDANYRLVTDATIPAALKNAVSEVALMQMAGTNIFPMQSTTGLIKSEDLKAGKVSISTTYAKPQQGESFEGFRKIDLIIAPLLKQTAGNWGLKA
jgi:hypothetical protein